MQSKRNAARGALVSRDDKICSSRQTIRTFHASVVKLTSTWDTLRTKATARTVEIAALRARPSIVLSGPFQSEYDAVV